MSPNSKVFTESTEYIVDSETYWRLSAGNCKCVLQADTHELLLWNLGSGKFVSYNFLLSSVHKMTVGMAMNAIVSSRELSLHSIGHQTMFTVKDFDRSLTEFAKLMTFRKQDFHWREWEIYRYIVSTSGGELDTLENILSCTKLKIQRSNQWMRILQYFLIRCCKTVK